MKIGIIGAMATEIDALLAAMNKTGSVRRAGMIFNEGTIGKTPCIVVRSGVGKVNAGCCVQIMADLFDVTHIINTGAAGSLNNDINIGDVVISTDAVHHDVDATIFGYKIGEVPQLGTQVFDADPYLIELVEKSCRKTAPDIGIFKGRIASGDRFISTRSVKDKIRETFGADCVEMEGASVAQAAYINNLPFVIMRSISDKADESISVDYDDFEDKAAAHSAMLLKALLEDLD